MDCSALIHELIEADTIAKLIHSGNKSCVVQWFNILTRNTTSTQLVQQPHAAFTPGGSTRFVQSLLDAGDDVVSKHVKKGGELCSFKAQGRLRKERALTVNSTVDSWGAWLFDIPCQSGSLFNADPILSLSLCTGLAPHKVQCRGLKPKQLQRDSTTKYIGTDIWSLGSICFEVCDLINELGSSQCLRSYGWSCLRYCWPLTC